MSPASSRFSSATSDTSPVTASTAGTAIPRSRNPRSRASRRPDLRQALPFADLREQPVSRAGARQLSHRTLDRVDAGARSSRLRLLQPQRSHPNKGVGCTTCHGQVDRMPLMWQEQSLQMEWCLDCHRNPERFVRPRDNGLPRHSPGACEPTRARPGEPPRRRPGAPSGNSRACSVLSPMSDKNQTGLQGLGLRASNRRQDACGAAALGAQPSSPAH